LQAYFFGKKEREMKTSIIGYPRIGKNRELKFAVEKYFNGDINENELEDIAKNLRLTHLREQENASIDFIPVGDFSFYDGMLDTAVLLGFVPKRYRDLGLAELDTYFAMAKGYQGKNGDVKALSMRKWFNTNYHYIVPEIESDMTCKLNSAKLEGEFLEAKSANISTKPVIIGPFTFLKLAKYTGEKSAEAFAEEIASVYSQLIEGLGKLGATLIQLDEPILVMDQSKADLELFEKIYSKILNNKGNTKILLQTYFGDIRDGYEAIINLPFDAIGLDFCEGKQSLDLLKKYGFPSDKALFLGLINGKNIWRNDYKKTLALLAEIKKHCLDSDIILSTSCSLLHVPYTLKSENKLPKEATEAFSFALEKLAEISELATLAEDDYYINSQTYQENCKIYENIKASEDNRVRTRIAGLNEADYTRLPKRDERFVLQREALKLPQLPTTTIGSFPQTKEVRTNRSLYKQGKITKEEYDSKLCNFTAECIKMQEDLGLDVLVHGEFERNDMVEYFGENLQGFLFTKNAWVQSYGTRCVKPPIIFSDISRKAQITVETTLYAQSQTNKMVKGMLTGPITIFNWSFPREDILASEQASQIALAIRDEVIDLEKAGIKIIQIDEAALREKLPLRRADWHTEYLDWAIPAFRLTHSGVAATTQIHTHMCYSEFEDIIKEIDAMDADVITFEASRSSLAILKAIKNSNFQTAIGPGVWDIHSPRVPTELEIIDALTLMLKTLDRDKLWVNPDCGLKTRGNKETIASLKNMVSAAIKVRKGL
jgi:5-methyltetrahydropteroyltriglutamate--homocysteine methyltransferase